MGVSEGREAGGFSQGVSQPANLVNIFVVVPLKSADNMAGQLLAGDHHIPSPTFVARTN